MGRILSNSRKTRFLIILMGALLLGLAWQIRGSGTSDPSVVAVLFLLFLAIHFGPRKKFNILIFGLITLLFNLMRTGWGTFVAQAGIPGVLPGHIPPNYGEGFDIVVGWWSGYFWMFIVGISWFGIPALLFGGYFFTKQIYTLKELIIIVILFVVSKFTAGFIAEILIPYLAPQYYHEIFLPGLSTRNYWSMHGNLSTALAIIPVLLYIRYAKGDRMFVRYAAFGMCSFAFALSVADVWWPLGKLIGLSGSTSWSLWEYFTGFIFGMLIFCFYNSFSNSELAKTDISMELNIFKWNPLERFILYGFAFYRLLLYGLAESIHGGIRLTSNALGNEFSPDIKLVKMAVGTVGLLLYWLYFRGRIGTAFAGKPIQEKSLIALIILLPLYYLNFAAQHVISGRIFLPDHGMSAVWLDTISFVIVETYCIWLFTRYRVLRRVEYTKEKHQILSK